MKSGYLLILLLTLAAVFSQFAHAGFPPRFTQLDIDDGLSMNTVNDLVTDQNGYLWIATQSGLNRYDGSNFVIFQADGSTSSTSGDDISHLHLARDGTLWLATVSDGINRYHAADQSFTHYIPARSGLPRQNVSDIDEDASGNIWVATSDNGIFVFSPTTETLVNRISKTDLGDVGVSSLYLHNDKVWIATGQGVFSYTEQQGLSRETQLPDSITEISSEGYDTLWLAGDNNLYEYQVSGQSLKDRSEWLPELPEGTSLAAVHAGLYGNLWLSIRNLGLVQIDGNGSRLHSPNAMDAGSLSSSTLGSIWEDKEGQLWIGTMGSGLNKLNLASLGWFHIRPGALRNPEITSLNTRAIYRDHQGILWVGTSQGLFKASEQGTNIVDLQPFNAPWSGLSSSFISFITQDNEQNFWIGTRGNGLLVLDSNYQLKHHFRANPLKYDALPNDSLYQFYLDNNNRPWVTTHGSGVARYDGPDKGFTVIKDEFGSNETSDIAQDAKGNYWIASYGGGVTRLTPDGSFTRFSTDTEVRIPSKHLMSIEFAGDTLWMASTDGIIAFNTESLTSKHFTERDGLLNDSAYLMHLDQVGRIWVGTAAGLSLIFPDTGVIQNFSVNDGIQGNEFNFGASFEDIDGTLYLGGTHGFNQMSPGQTLNSPKPASPLIDKIRLMNDTRQLSPLLIDEGEELGININHQTNLFALYFHSPSLSQGEQLSYQYRMLGFNDTWFDASNNEVTFTGLTPGNYQLQLRAVNLSRNFSDITRLNVRIAPPPWHSWWAYGLYGLMILSIFGLIIYVWQQKFRVQQQLLLQLSRSEQRLNLALWSSGDEFWDWELGNSQVIRSNTFLKYPSDEVNLQETVMATVHPDEQEKVMRTFKACLKGKIETVHISYRGRAKDGEEWIWVECRGKITERGDEGQASRITGTIKNIQALKDTEGALRLLNMELEDRVEARTRELRSSQSNLENMLQELQLTQEELRHKEKMATLGGLVASITHEVGTPVGVCITASSNLLDRIRDFNHMYQCNEVSEGDFAQYQEDVEESCRLFLTNMKRVSKLMSSFKHVAVDQSHDEITQFNFHSYLMEIQQSMEPMLKRTHHHYQITCPDDLWLKTNPGVFYQIVSNLFNNSIMHAFSDGQTGNMTLTVNELNDGVVIEYQDDGCGMSAEVRDQIFCPFFTTKRGKGGSGLGMNIVFNLVTQVLQGELEVESSPGAGTTIRIILPVTLQIEQPRKEA